MSRTVFNPLKQTEPVAANNIMTVASSDCVAYNQDTPRSPMSNEAMQVVQCGPHRGPNFKVWVHIKDRLVLPFRE